MFRSLYEEFQNPAIDQLNANIVRYSSTEPNLTVMNTQNNYPFPNAGNEQQRLQASNVQLQNSVNILGTVSNPAFGITTESQPNLASIVSGIPDALGDRMKECRTYTGLAGLSNLMGSVNLAAEQRCGWRYKAGQGVVAEVAQGAFGTRGAPLDPARPQVDTVGNGVNYYWNLQDAEKQMVKDICKAATNCQDMGAVPVSAVGDFSNVCGYCKTSKKIIPIRRQGNSVSSRYTDVDMQCAPSEIVTVNNAATQCPPPDPGQQEAVYWKCLNQGNLERDCVTLSALYAGCSPTGTLVSALTEGTNPQDYADKLRLKKSYQVYQSLANPVISEDVVRNGNATIFASFMNMYGLNQNQYLRDPNKTDDVNTRIQVAATDLCRQSGYYDSYNFCSDLTDQTRDFEVNCMQQEFLKQGGTVEGTAYPRTKTAGQSWGDYKRSVADILRRTNSSDIMEQREALNQLKGLGLQAVPTSLPRGEQSQGVEVFYFNWQTNTFLGRRAILSASGSNLPNFNVGGGIVEDLGVGDFVKFYSIFDLRPQNFMKVKFGVVTDDGMVLAMNQNPEAINDSSKVFSRNYDQGPTWHDSQCFDIQAETANIPNIFTWYWYERGGGAVFHPFYADCTRGSWIEIAQRGFALNQAWRDMCYFTQELDAPMLTFAVYQRSSGLFFQERRLTAQFPMTNRSGEVLSASREAMFPRNWNLLRLRDQTVGINVSLAFSAFRTVTLCFNLESVDRDRFLVRWLWNNTNGIRLRIKKASDTTSTLNMSVIGLNGTSEFLTSSVTLRNNTWYIAAIQLGTASRFTKKIDRVSFFAQELKSLQEAKSIPSSSILSVQPNTILFDEIKQNAWHMGAFSIGDTGVRMQVGWLDFFEQTLPTTDAQLWKKAATRGWLGRWYE